MRETVRLGGTKWPAGETSGCVLFVVDLVGSQDPRQGVHKFRRSGLCIFILTALLKYVLLFRTHHRFVKAWMTLPLASISSMLLLLLLLRLLFGSLCLFAYIVLCLDLSQKSM